MVKISLKYKKEDMEPYYYGCLFTEDFLFYFDQKNDTDIKFYCHTYTLKPNTEENRKLIEEFLTLDGFKCFPNIEVEIPQDKYNGLVKLLQENPKSITVKVQEDNILEKKYKIFKEIKDEIHKQLEQGHISKIY